MFLIVTNFLKIGCGNLGLFNVYIISWSWYTITRLGFGIFKWKRIPKKKMIYLQESKELHLNTSYLLFLNFEYLHVKFTFDVI